MARSGIQCHDVESAANQSVASGRNPTVEGDSPGLSGTKNLGRSAV